MFGLLLAVGLAGWARATATLVPIPMVASMPLGIAIALFGAVLVSLGAAPQHVTQALDSVLPHSTYMGFSILCAGVSIADGSTSGLWLVSPIVMLGCTALVLGYKRGDFPGRIDCNSRRVLPKGGSGPPRGRERLACYSFVLLPWLITYEAIVVLRTPPNGVVTLLPFERHLPVLEWTEVFYASTYIVTGLVPLFAKTGSDLRTFCVRGLGAMAVAFPLYLIAPMTSPFRPFTVHTILGRLLSWERIPDSPALAFPSFHVIWAVLAAEVFARRWPRVRWLCVCWALLVAVSCVTTGQHGILDVLGGLATVALVERGLALWEAIRSCAERAANSWSEWRIGPVRVLNHGVYAGAGASFAVSIAGMAAGRGHELVILISAAAVVAAAVLWTRQTEESPRRLRVFGLYGGILGVMLSALLAPVFSTDAWLVLAALCVGAPWAQALGRVGCLVQGCCYGRPAPASIGIRYLHPRSGVCRVTTWTGVPLHPTPVYAIFWNIFVALALTRLWDLHTALHLIAGLYFIFTGLGQFVEEAWRGEPDLPVFERVRPRQWVAFGSVIAGALITGLGNGGSAPAFHFAWLPLLPAAAFGLLVCVAMGIDFRASNRRISVTL